MFDDVERPSRIGDFSAASGRHELPLCPVSVGRSSPARRSTPLARDSLAIIRFGGNTPVPDDPRAVLIHLDATEEPSPYEIWTSDLPVRTGAAEGIRYAEDGLMLFGWLSFDETHLADLEETTRRAHTAILRLLHRLDFPHWLRAWTYLSAINDGAGDRERYRRFVVGRHRALARTPGFERLLPASTVVGTRRMRNSTGLTLCLLASRVPGIQIENPRQVSAFDYPRIYGPKSPSFSRAVLQHWRDRSILYVSGTASIVGHATTHADDPVAQLEEAFRNIDALLDHASRQQFSVPHPDRFQLLTSKLFVRDRQVLRAVDRRWRSSFADRAPTIVLVADLCRRDLLVEVEAVFEYCPTNCQHVKRML